MSRLNSTWIYSFIVLSCIGLLAYAYYSELVGGLEPCPLCVTQRFFVLLTGVFALIALCHRPARLGAGIYSGLMLASSAGGGAVAARQLWLQSLPEDRVPACGPSLEYMLEAFPLSETLRAMVVGDGNCAEISWTFLGLSMPAWTLIWFLILAVASIASFTIQPRR